VKLWNASGYDTRDLYRFFMAGLRAMGIPERRIRSLRVAVTSAPKRSRGCADVGGTRVSIAIAPPSYSPHREFIRRLARLWEHEVAHSMGFDHDDMPERLLYSNGKTPRWARPWSEREHVIRYTRKPVADQLTLLTKGSNARTHRV
jgi:hypothetical protein